MWDQLKTVMKDPEKNPFPGFEEHTIDFPPTFKYDVSRDVCSPEIKLMPGLALNQGYQPRVETKFEAPGHFRGPKRAQTFFGRHLASFCA